MTPERRKQEEAVAQDYALLIRGPFRSDWRAINAEIIDRWSLTALLRIKRRARQIVKAA